MLFANFRFGLGWVLAAVVPAFASAADLYQITAERRVEIGGKEVDWIDGDYVLSNDRLIAVVANPIVGRDANMTTRGVGGCLIDLTRTGDMSDQLSAVYPTAQQFEFADDALLETEVSDGEVRLSITSSGSQRSSATARVEYRLRDGDDFIEAKVTVRGDDLAEIATACSVRADRTFQFDRMTVDQNHVAYFTDAFFRQTYGITTVKEQSSPSTWDDQRARRLTFDLDSDRRGERTWTMRLYPAASLSDLAGSVLNAAPQTVEVTGAIGELPRIELSVSPIDDSPTLPEVATDQSIYTDGVGRSVLHLPAGKYNLVASAIGHRSTSATIDVSQRPGNHSIELGPATRIVATVVDGSGQTIPAKLTFIGVDGTESPDFGPDTADGSIRDCVYTTGGKTIRSLPPGDYDVVFSHGPEYAAEVQRVRLRPGEEATLNVTLKRDVDTAGWISAELHSHSSPSGDNTSSQLGRVQNLVCENIEFGPCTEHQRIDTYEDHLDESGARDLMATCSGMELTGGPLPINHQNAFPLRWAPHQQNGGGPRTDQDPITQIKRLAMWDDEADKVVQINHPNLNQMARDKDKDGTDDGGFASMFQFADVIEVHPPQAIFDDPDELSDADLVDNRMLQWMRLISEGQFIPGVVNTDAHYNHHGSGWLRNWVQSSTDDPAEIDIDEMTRHLEAGKVIMSTGPFMTLSLNSKEWEKAIGVGDTATLAGDTTELAVKVQCANWLDIDRVEVFVNGRRVPELSRRRQTHPDAFADGVVKFDQTMPVSIDDDSFIIVAAIGENQVLGRVMGETFGQLPPVVVSNPIFVRRESIRN